ncbi:Tat pathway signal sequence domain protein [Zavarzinia compransoris]|nr:Tat pathway signal sequence domain protein [Zavarzinia marina]
MRVTMSGTGRRVTALLAPALFGIAALGASARAQEAEAPGTPAAEEAPAPISIELNKLEAQDGACRAYLVLVNPAGPDITDLKLDLILFNQDQVIERRIAVGLSPLPTGKTTVKLFDIQGQDCGRVGSVLINEVMACSGADGEIPDCTKRIAPTSRVDAKLFK